MTVFKIERVNETVSTTYRELFMIRFVHAGYESATEKYLSRGIHIAPDTATKKLFNDHRVDYRFYSDTLVCFIECAMFNPPTAEPKIPFVSIGSDFKMRFLVTSGDELPNRTFVVAAGSKRTYQFSNKIDNAGGGGVLYLTHPVENHSPGKDYETGTVVQDGVSLFATLKTVLAADGISLSDTNFWKALQPVEQVVNNADLYDNAVVNPSSICFAVIDIFKNGTLNNSYRIFDVSDKLFNPAPVFTIIFNSKI